MLACDESIDLSLGHLRLLLDNDLLFFLVVPFASVAGKPHDPSLMAGGIEESRIFAKDIEELGVSLFFVIFQVAELIVRSLVVIVYQADIRASNIAVAVVFG